VDQIHAHHQRPEKDHERQQTDSTQLSQAAEKGEIWQDVENVVLSGDELEEPARSCSSREGP